MKFTAFSRPGRFYRGNLHTHSTASDGTRTPEEVCRVYRKGGYDFLCLSDHFVEAYGFPITDTRPFRTDNFTTILGAEVHAGATRFGGPWHILAAGLPLNFAKTKKGETGPALAARCAAAGAFVAVAHPAWYGLGVDEAMSLKAAHAVEIYNHSCARECDRADDGPFYDQLLNFGWRGSACATDDAHFRINDWIGGWVYVKAQKLDERTLVKALREGAFYSSTGPQIHDVSLKGKHLTVLSSACNRIIVLGAGCEHRRIEGYNLTEASFDLSDWQSPWLRLVVLDSQDRRAWTNAAWQ